MQVNDKIMETIMTEPKIIRKGSCNISKKRIWLNLELAKKPPECLEYIIVHELVHLLERYHNDRFREHLGRFLPTWQHSRDVLRGEPLGHEDWVY
jgi:predicted metal-dependent hydrolase